MCLLPGLADGRFLLDNEVLPEALAVDSDLLEECTCHGSDHADRLSRRSLLRRSATMLAGGALAGALDLTALAATTQAQGTPGDAGQVDRLVMLGVSGGPVINAKASPATALVIDGQKYLVDCGGDTARQIADTGLGFFRLRDVFITHHHLDHVAGIPALATLGWTYSPDPLTGRMVEFWGPPPIGRLVRQSRAAFDFPIEIFKSGNPRFPDLRPRELALPRRGIVKVMEDDNVVVSATRVYHGSPKLVKDAYAYRFDVKSSGKAVVFSGDTRGPDKRLVALAEGADILVHEVILPAALDPFLARVDARQRAGLRKLILDGHTDVAVLPAIAKAAAVKRVVMNHYSPPQPPPEAFLAAARQAAQTTGYTGEIVAANDKDTILL